MKKMTDQELANFYNRPIYIYRMKDGARLASFFQYEDGDFYGGRKHQQIEKRIKTFIPVKK